MYSASGTGGLDLKTDDFDEFVFELDGTAKRVYTRGVGPAVIVCHELTGLSPACLALASRIEREGFKVFVPLLFGSPGQNSFLKGTAQICLSREFRILALSQTSPVSRWLTALADEAAERAGRPDVAAIGMCATGGVVLATLLSDSVRGVVSSQPSLPMNLPLATRRRRSDLGLSPPDLEAVVATGKPVMAFRFKRDFICPRERLQTIADSFQGATVCEIPTTGSYGEVEPPIGRLAHSVLAFEHATKEGHPTYEAFGDVIEFLNSTLDAAPGGT